MTKLSPDCLIVGGTSSLIRKFSRKGIAKALSLRVFL
ncbi:hypothetical protein CUJ84_pRLN1000734 (plasmid) [Rhizobium leguminosarum]|uniref:Uncharacterized protein n=1 Tax=Rhizobium leguminosarum TaxID=384 RepID=A0A2K9ZD78_RHILE|nr:hypothetical protein CUJ84_pRLN1000734 [Rhizobium leguminosarum]